MTNKIEPHILQILKNCTAKEDRIYINSPDLEREDYVKVNVVFSRLRGKWNRSKGCHIFPFDIEELFAAVLESGLYPEDNPESYFYTPTKVVQEILQVLDIPDSEWVTVLEPTAGTGHIADELPKNVQLDCVELTDLNCELLRKKGYSVIQGDFLQYKPDKNYHYIVMNPPFNIPGTKNVYIDMIYHGFSMLKPHSRLVAIVPTSYTYRSDKKHAEFRDFLGKYMYSGWELEQGTFKEAGTNIATHVIFLDKNSDWKEKPKNGYNSWNAYMTALYAENDRETFDNLEKSLRSKTAFYEFLDGVVLTANNKHFEGIYLTEKDKSELWDHYKYAVEI